MLHVLYPPPSTPWDTSITGATNPRINRKGRHRQPYPKKPCPLSVDAQKGPAGRGRSAGPFLFTGEAGYWLRTCTSPIVMFAVDVKSIGITPVCPMPAQATSQ